jgi:suppressor of ftsI/bilirubin oxidase
MKGSQALPFHVIGTDGGLLDAPYQASEVFLAPAERLDVLLDLSALQVGDELWLQTLKFDPMDTMSMLTSGSPHTLSSTPSNARSKTPSSTLSSSMSSASTHLEVSQPFTLPSTLSTLTRIDTTGRSVRQVKLVSSATDSMLFTINGETFQMDQYPITVQRGSVEIWEVYNVPPANNVSSMPHPLHIHGAPFQVLSRQGSPSQAGTPVDTSGRFVTDLGWKDTVLVWPGETVRLAMDFTNPYAGDQTLVMHCHILEHEDSGMMINIKVS